MSWTDTNKGRPGGWFNWEDVTRQAVEGSDGTVAIVKNNFNVTATADKIYEFTSMTEAIKTFGSTKVADINRSFMGGASKVIVYTNPTGEADYSKAQNALQLQFFESLTFDHPLTPEQVVEWKTWANEQAVEDRYIPVFYGVDDDTDVTAGIARAVTDNDEYIETAINAPVVNGVTWKSWESANWLAGLFAKTPLNQSMTYAELPNGTDVSVRLTNAQIVEGLSKGAMMFEYNGRVVRLVKGVSTAGTSLKRLAFKQAFTRDIKFFLESNYIGKVPNGPNQRLNAEGTLKSRYMQPLEDQEVILPGWDLKVLPGPEKQQVFVDVSCTDMETMEEFYFTISLGGDQ